MTTQDNTPDPAELGLNTDQSCTLWLLTADPETWELSDAPAWLAKVCADLGLAFEVAPGLWKKTLKGANWCRGRRGRGRLPPNRETPSRLLKNSMADRAEA